MSNYRSDSLIEEQQEHIVEDDNIQVELMTDEKWQAIINNDATFDNQFFYAIRTTGIFCRPSCKSRVPKKENVRIFQYAAQALSANFRPCKRCKPTGERLPDQEWIDIIIQYIDNHYCESLTIQTLADMCHGSPYHLQRTFKRVTGISPVQYVQQLRIEKAKEQLRISDLGIMDIALLVGMTNVPYFTTLFKKMTGFTPAQYRQYQRNNN